jgi:hypothetical protein
MVLCSLPKLEVLNLSNNKVQELPAEVSMMSGLNKLNMMNNQLADVPDELAALSRLTQFDFSGNQFTGEVQQKILRMMSGETTTAPAEKATRVKKVKAPAKKKAASKKK